jgi:hypothetical protein
MAVCSAVDLAVALAHWGCCIEDARAHIGMAQRIVRDLEDHVPARGWTLLGAAEVALAEGNAAAALVELTAAFPLLLQGSTEGLAQAHRVAGLAHLACGHGDLASSHIASSLGAAVRLGQKLEEVCTRTVWQTAEFARSADQCAAPDCDGPGAPPISTFAVGGMPEAVLGLPRAKPSDGSMTLRVVAR